MRDEKLHAVCCLAQLVRCRKVRKGTVSVNAVRIEMKWKETDKYTLQNNILQVMSTILSYSFARGGHRVV